MQQRAEKSAEKGTYLCISSPPNLKPTNSQSQMFSHPSCHDHKIVRKTQLTCPQAFVPTVCPRCLPQLHRWPEYLLPVSPFNASIERRNSRPNFWGRPRNYFLSPLWMSAWAAPARLSSSVSPSIPPPPSPPSCRAQYSLPRLMRDAEAAVRRWLTTATATWAWKKNYCYSPAPSARLDTPPTPLHPAS